MNAVQRRFLRPTLILALAAGCSVALIMAIMRLDASSGQRTGSGGSNEVARSSDDGLAAERGAGISALGYLRPEGDTIKLGNPAEEIQPGQSVARIYIREGQTVSKGQKLIDFDSLELVSVERTALLTKISTLSKQISLIEGTIRTYQRLLATTAFAPSELESRQLRVLELSAELEQTKLDLAKNAIKARMSRLLSPVNGRVIRVNINEGERSTGRILIELSTFKDMEAVIHVDEQSIGKIRRGQGVLLTSENGSFGGELPATVSFVSSRVGTRRQYSSSPTLDSDAEERVFEVRARVEPARSVLVSNLIGAKVVARFPSNTIK